MERSESNSSRRTLRICRVLTGSATVVVLYSCLAFGQQPGLTTLPSAEQVIQRNQDPYAGSLTQGKATNEVIELSVADALDRGLKYNLGLYLSERSTDQTRAERLRAPTNLMPVISGGFTEK